MRCIKNEDRAQKLGAKIRWTQTNVAKNVFWGRLAQYAGENEPDCSLPLQQEKDDVAGNW